MRPFGIDVKRFYLPFVVRATCPRCGEVRERNLCESYLSFPVTGERDLAMHCHYDDHEWMVRVRLVVQLDAVEGCTVDAL